MTVTVTPKTQTIENGQDNDATIVEQEFSELYTNDQLLANAINELTDNAYTFTNEVTFDAGLITDTITEETANNGVVVDGMPIKDGHPNIYNIRAIVGSVDTASETITTTANHGITSGTVGKLRAVGSGATLMGGTSPATTYYFSAPTANTLKLHLTQANAQAGTSPVNLTSAGSGTRQIIAAPAAPLDGEIWATDGIYLRQGGSTRKMLMTGDSVTPKNYITGGHPTWTSVSSITFPAGMRMRDSTNTDDIELAADITASITTNGAAGLDTGSEAPSTWYYAYLIKNPTTSATSVVLSATNESNTGSITLPSGFTLKRQIKIAFRNNSSSDLVNFAVVSGWPYMPLVTLLRNVSYYQNVSTTAVYSGNLATNTVDCSASVPPIARSAQFAILNNNPSPSFVSIGIQPSGLGLTAGQLILGGAATDTSVGISPVSASQAIDVKSLQGGGFSYAIDVTGFIVTEVD